MEWEVGVAQQAVNGSIKRLQGESEKQWDLMCLAVLSFICATDDSMMIRFPRKDVFLFQPHARSRCRIKKPKSWRFEIF
jgi:hypothetical protein